MLQMAGQTLRLFCMRKFKNCYLINRQILEIYSPQEYRFLPNKTTWPHMASTVLSLSSSAEDRAHTDIRTQWYFRFCFGYTGFFFLRDLPASVARMRGLKARTTPACPWCLLTTSSLSLNHPAAVLGSCFTLHTNHFVQVFLNLHPTKANGRDWNCGCVLSSLLPSSYYLDNITSYSYYRYHLNK